MQNKAIRFSKSTDDFAKELRKRVNQYFKDNNINRYANTNMVLKTIFMLSLYFVPFVLILTVFENSWLTLLMWILMGFGMSGIGLSIMHDANHHAYSKNAKINVLLGKLLVFVGGSDVNWRIQHNVLHHTYTNVAGMDEDIDSGILMRFSPDQKKLKGHKYQHIYAWFLYGFMTIMWVFSKDYAQYTRYKKRGLLETQGITSRQFLTSLIISKALYLGVFLVLPIIFSSAPLWITFLGFFIMHFVAGLTLACIFQPAHVVPTSEFQTPDLSGNIEKDWAANQLLNTANFANKSRLFSWYVGGLNYQIEHHLFPNICHVHYRKISHIVRETAFEYNLPYHSYATFLEALRGHAKMLKNLGRNDEAPAIH
ncbi:MAG: fatty acid desaturase family protein [Fluviicola sp.]